jgi:hypothetical protein
MRETIPCVTEDELRETATEREKRDLRLRLTQSLTGQSQLRSGLGNEKLSGPMHI